MAVCDRFGVRFPLEGKKCYIFLFVALVKRQSVVLSFATKYAMPSEFGRKLKIDIFNGNVVSIH